MSVIQPKPNRQVGFTLVELMIVVAVVGLLAAIAVPSFIRARESSTNARYIGDLRVARQAFQIYAIEKKAYPPDSTPAIVPTGMDEYLGRFDWRGRNSLGGLWDWDYGVFGVRAGVSVYRPTAAASQMGRIDEIIDDADLSTGSFRSRSDGYISIIE
jgi:prepilin-type N-terminal cleavage/methylation domain-containing protein